MTEMMTAHCGHDARKASRGMATRPRWCADCNPAVRQNDDAAPLHLIELRRDLAKAELQLQDALGIARQREAFSRRAERLLENALLRVGEAVMALERAGYVRHADNGSGQPLCGVSAGIVDGPNAAGCWDCYAISENDPQMHPIQAKSRTLRNEGGEVV